MNIWLNIPFENNFLKPQILQKFVENNWFCKTKNFKLDSQAIFLYKVCKIWFMSIKINV